MSEVFVTGVEGLDVRVPHVELSWEIFRFTHSCFISFHFMCVCLGKSSVPAGSHRVQSLYPAEGTAQMGAWAELLGRAPGEASLDKGLPVLVILIRALAA